MAQRSNCDTIPYVPEHLDILPLLEKIQAIARNGLTYAKDFYDRERYEKLLELANEYTGLALDLRRKRCKNACLESWVRSRRNLVRMRRSLTIKAAFC